MHSLFTGSRGTVGTTHLSPLVSSEPSGENVRWTGKGPSGKGKESSNFLHRSRVSTRRDAGRCLVSRGYVAGYTQ